MTGGPDDGDDPRKINILKYEGNQKIRAPEMLIKKLNQPLSIQKVNIMTKEEPKFVNIGGYWDEETMVKITHLLHEFQDLFSTNFFEMKGILGDLGEMKIPLNLHVKPVKQRPYLLNP